MRRLILGILALSLYCGASLATRVKDVARMDIQGESVLQGLGLVLGLPGTGDSGKDLVLARPLAQVLANNGAPIANFEELKSSRSVALVMVTCKTPAAGVRLNDQYDVIVTVLHSATSLKGGELYLTAMTGPRPGQPVYAMARGPIEVDDETIGTRGRVRRGAQIVRPFPQAIIGDSFDLVVEPSFAGFQTTTHIAGRIRDEYQLAPDGFSQVGEPIAQAIDDRTIRIRVPSGYKSNPTPFIADVMNTEFDAGQLKLPARVVVNRRTGAIIATQDVRISLVAIAHRNLIVRRINPAPQATPAAPLISTDSVAGVGTDIEPQEQARLDDLLNAFKALDVPVEDQIEILHMLEKSGRLNAELIVD